MTPVKNYDDPEAAVLDAFGNFRMEWTEVPVTRYFAEPSYFHLLQTLRPCVIVGGRGTGKTTALRALQTHSSKKNSNLFEDRLAVYLKIGPHIPNNFYGPERKEEEWSALFLKYVHIVLCELAVDRLTELRQTEPLILSEQAANRLLEVLGGSPPESSIRTGPDLLKELRLASLKIESHLNSTVEDLSVSFKQWETPLTLLYQAVLRPAGIKGVVFLIDEYENLLSYQQRIFNTLIKFSNDFVTYKIGIKQRGWKTKETCVAQESLRNPADYALINIASEEKHEFARFATKVIQRRIEILSGISRAELTTLMPGLSALDEARRLAGEKPNALKKSTEAVSKEISKLCTNHECMSWADELDHYCVEAIASARGLSLKEYLENLLSLERVTAKARVRNYRNVALYSLGAKKTELKKYYCGWPTLCSLAGGNIRFLMELTQEVYLRHLKAGFPIQEPVSQELQTISSIAVAERNLYELEGMTVYGRRLIRLVQGLGTFFSACARNGFNHAPDLNQFTVKPSISSNLNDSIGAEMDELLSEAVMHLALLQLKATKRGESTQLMSEDYTVHPIYAPYFRIPFQRKRKMTMTPSIILELSKTPGDAVVSLLKVISAKSALAPDSVQISLDF